MKIDSANDEKPHKIIAWVLVPLYLFLCFVTALVAALLIYTLAAAPFTYPGFQGYCYHGGKGELAAVVVMFGWPVILFHILISLLVGRTFSRASRLFWNLILPVAILVSVFPCLIR